MQSKEKIKVGISIGDLNGIGSEVVLKTFQDRRMLELCTPVIFASAKILSYIKKHLNLQVDIFGVDDATKAVHNKVNVVNVWRESVDINFGQEDEKIGAYAIKSLKAATKALKNNEIDVLVTAPISKSNIQADDFKFPGHTDYLDQELEGDSLMFMITNSLRVGLLTDHVAVKDVSSNITEELITKKLSTINKSLQVDFGIRKPKIAVLGINPHVGDNGVIGKEDDEVLKPTLKSLNEKGMLTYGPYAADSFFGSDNYKKFDAVIAAYHDQGLIPFKTLSFGQGVNYTAGLSHVRTSPDHGTAYEIAGKGQADHSSFEEAVFKAISIYKKRSEYKELSANPLRKFKREQKR
ncbi:4-hydroxythreonine-4-phosphate dehydrogenase PdxA [Spongiivirga citrea]|uniref:4-hydroxythreonine-4-phosphate dehydrogenase PdxA n=1 Tax=Spongiivirga citrea TaxID=1481457 RepID=A0A6M0CHA0_9FLAO|nr:4-hydroxythreonine-4-phosphate dehydrogenase PdxA [Spongiivirga citrea]NER17318.1 4-hydroxythreonine-4-phosphate dehydrogenase PdxA [Spongiivirga citrea]